MKPHYLSSEEEVAIKASVPWDDIDHKILDLVQLANSVEGLVTLQSCAGHVTPHPGESGHFLVESAYIAFRATEARVLQVLFDLALEIGIRDISIRYFDDGSFWLCPEVEPSSRGKLYELFRLLGG